jgi:hypothetical protein
MAVPTPGNHTEMLRTLSACATELTSAWMQPSADRQHAALTVASQRYAKALALTTKDIMAGLEVSAVATKGLLQLLHMDMQHSNVAHRLGLVTQPVATQPASLAVQTAEVQRQTCQERLAAGVQNLAHRLLEPFKINAIVLSVLQILQQSASFRQVIFCVREAKSNALVGCIAVGAAPSGDKDPGRLRIGMEDSSDLFTATAFKGEDLWLPDVAVHLTQYPTHALPTWVRKSMGASSVLLLPLHLKSQPLGVIYADRGTAESSALPLGAKELALMGTLRNQVVLAFRQRAF